jgi:uncharacterized protein YggU (UPF0235/DUF167 family)
LTSATGSGRARLRPWRHGDACVVAHFRLTPKASNDAVDGLIETIDGTAFSARVRALPVDGGANKALEDLVARWLGVSKRSVSLVSGGKSRLKSLRIDGDPATLDMMLEAQVSKFQRSK